MQRYQWILRGLIALASGLALPAALAADAPYPVPGKPITLIVPYSAGSDTDIFARLLGKAAAKYMNNQAFVYDARPGASGVTATQFARKAAPDGYTLTMTRIASMVLSPLLVLEPPYQFSDFTVLALTETAPLICAVRADSPYSSVRVLLAAIRHSPGSLKYSTVGEGTLPNLAVQYMLSLSGLKSDSAVGLHFDSATKATAALLDGRADFVCNTAGSMVTPIQAGQLRGLFSTTSARMQVLPKLPNAREVGLRDMTKMQTWAALVGPAKLPANVIKRWKEVLLKVGKDPEWLAEHERLGAQSMLASSQDPVLFIQDQYLVFDELITTLGLRK